MAYTQAQLDALEAALKAGFATHLATDSFTAKRLIARNSG